MTMHTGKGLAAATSVFLFFMGALPPSARAQAIHEGKVTGIVAGEDRAVIPGATVEVAGPALMGPRSAVSSASGTYVLLNLPAGRYTVTASLSGFKTIVRENIDVGADSTVTLDFLLPVGSYTETVTVSAEGPLIDNKTATVDSRIDQELIARLPTSRDAFYNLALTMPGMFDSASSNSLPSPTAYGSATNENVFLINGVNATNPEAGSFGTLVNVNYDAVEEVRVVGLGFEGRVRELLGGGGGRRDQVGQQPVPRERRLLLAPRQPVEQPAGARRGSRRGLPLHRRGRAARRRDEEGLGGERHARWSHPQGQDLVLRRL